MTHRISVVGIALALAGCILEPEKREVFPFYVSGYVRLVQAHGADGSVGTTLGLGVEDAGLNELALSDFPPDPDPDSGTTGILPGSFHFGTLAAFSMTLTRQSTTLYSNKYSHEYLAVHPETKWYETYPGHPCRFSKPKGYQLVSQGGDTIPLVFSGIHVEVIGDSLRVALLIDTAASKAADARASFSGDRWVYGTATADCPEF